MTQQVKDPALSVQQLESLCCMSSSQEISACQGGGQKKKKKKKGSSSSGLHLFVSLHHYFFKRIGCRIRLMRRKGKFPCVIHSISDPE